MGLEDERELTLKVTISADEDLETLEIFLSFALSLGKWLRGVL